MTHCELVCVGQSLTHSVELHSRNCFCLTETPSLPSWVTTDEPLWHACELGAHFSPLHITHVGLTCAFELGIQHLFLSRERREALLLSSVVWGIRHLVNRIPWNCLSRSLWLGSRSMSTKACWQEKRLPGFKLFPQCRAGWEVTPD